MAAPRKGGLGRGLEDLFREVEIEVSDEKPAAQAAPEAKQSSPAPGENSIVYIDIHEIRPNKAQPRKYFDEEKLTELADSILEHGIIQPLVIRKEDAGYELVAGERRWRAARKAGLKRVPCLIRELTSEQNMLFALIENLQREDLNVIEEAEAMDRLMTEYGLTQVQVSKSVGKSRPYVTNILRLLRLPEEVRGMVERGELTAGHARALITIETPERAIALAKQAVAEKFSVREVEKRVSELGQPQKKAKPRKAKSPDTAAAEQTLKEALGTKVVINDRGKRGRIEIEYYSREELERLLELLRTLK